MLPLQTEGNYLYSWVVFFQNLFYCSPSLPHLSPAEMLGLGEETLLEILQCSRSSNIYSTNIDQLTVSHVSLNKDQGHLVKLTLLVRIKLLKRYNTPELQQCFSNVIRTSYVSYNSFSTEAFFIKLTVKQGYLF